MELREEVRALLAENDWKCNADGRRYAAERVTAPIAPRELEYQKWKHVLK